MSVIIGSTTCFIKVKKRTNIYIKKMYILANFIEELGKASLDIFVICWIFKSQILF